MRTLLVTAGLCVSILLLLLPACGPEWGEAWNPEPHARVGALLRETAHDDPVVRRDAIAALGKIWPAGARSVPVLTAALDDDDDERVRDAAAVALETLGAQAPAPLAAFLRDEEDGARRTLVDAINAILRLGAKATPKDLIGSMRTHPRSGLVAVALLSQRRTLTSPRRDDPLLTSFLAYYANPANVKAAGLDDPRIPETAAACTALFGMSALPVSPTREASPEMLSLLESEDPATAALGAALVGGMGSAHPDSLRALHALASREKFGGARMAALTLGFLEGGPPAADTEGEEAAASVPALENALAEIARITAPDARRYWNADVMRAVQELRVLARDLTAEQKSQVAESMAALLAEEELGWIHAEAVAVLGALGSAAAPAVPALTHALTAANATWKDLLADGKGDLATVYVDNTRAYHQAFETRRAAVDALGSIGSAAAAARSLLEALVADGAALIRYHAARALRKL